MSPPLCKEKLQVSTWKSFQQCWHPFAQQLSLNLEHSLIQFEILGQIASLLLAFTCWQQWLHFEVMIEAVLNGQIQSGSRPLLKGYYMHHYYWS